MLAAAVASFGEHSLGTDQSNSISMDLFSAFGEYINPFTCPINVFEVHVLENPLLCCPFWFVNDLTMAFIEQQCGTEVVDSIETYQEMLIPMMRQRCPANREDQAGCQAIHRMLLFLLVVCCLVWVLSVAWAVAITVSWWRLKKRTQNSALLPDCCTSQSKKVYSSSNRLQVELLPLTNGQSSKEADEARNRCTAS